MERHPLQLGITYLFAAAVVCCLLLADGVGAEGRGTLTIGNFAVGGVVRPSAPGVPLRESTPGFLGRYGRELDKTSEKDIYIVREEKRIPRYFWEDLWLRITPVQKQGNDWVVNPDVDYWAYWGSIDADSKTNFIYVDPEEIDSSLRESITNEWWK